MPDMYCEIADIRTRFGADDEAVAQAIRDASVFIRAFLDRPPAIPFMRADGTVPGAIKEVAIRTATRYLQVACDWNNTEADLALLAGAWKDHRADIGWLGKVSRGVIQLDLEAKP